MKSVLLAGAVLAIAASLASARGGGRASGGRGFVGRPTYSRSGGGRGFVSGGSRVSSGGSGFGRFAASRSGFVSRSGGSFLSGRRAYARGSFVPSRVARRADAGGSGDQSPAPYLYTPGALIRTAGQLPQYSKADGGGAHSVEGGGFIAQDAARARDVGRAPGISWSPPDKMPGANPSGGAGGNGVTANPGGGATIVDNDHSGNANGNSNYSGTGFDPSF